MAESRSAGIFAPDVKQGIVQVAGSENAGVIMIYGVNMAGVLPAVKIVLQNKNLPSV